MKNIPLQNRMQKDAMLKRLEDEEEGTYSTYE